MNSDANVTATNESIYYLSSIMHQLELRLYIARYTLMHIRYIRSFGKPKNITFYRQKLAWCLLR